MTEFGIGIENCVHMLTVCIKSKMNLLSGATCASALVCSSFCFAAKDTMFYIQGAPMGHDIGPHLVTGTGK